MDYHWIFGHLHRYDLKCDSIVIPLPFGLGGFFSSSKHTYLEIISHAGLYLSLITDIALLPGSMAIWTKVSDIVGRKQTTIAALVILLAFSFGCGFAQTVNQL